VLVCPFFSRAACCCSSVVVCAPTDEAIASPTAASDQCFMPFPLSSLIYRSSRERRISHFAYAKALSVYAVLMRRKIPTIYFAACESIIGKVPAGPVDARLAPARVETTETLLLLFLQDRQAMSVKTKKRTGRSRRWSARVTQRSNALDLEPKVFRSSSPRKIALSLKSSAERSKS